ncbi:MULTISPECIES: DUF677 domain-containing protein [unclassified Sphingomonas]|nr:MULTISPECIES: DUF677 domain-containing protein [unclassified Sphingomonas]
MDSQYKNRTSIPQLLVALVATVLVGSVALAGTVGPAMATVSTVSAPYQA